MKINFKFRDTKREYSREREREREEREYSGKN